MASCSSAVGTLQVNALPTRQLQSSGIAVRLLWISRPIAPLIPAPQVVRRWRRQRNGHVVSGPPISNTGNGDYTGSQRRIDTMK